LYDLPGSGAPGEGGVVNTHAVNILFVHNYHVHKHTGIAKLIRYDWEGRKFRLFLVASPHVWVANLRQMK
jgi:hypothetical protein